MSTISLFKRSPFMVIALAGLVQAVYLATTAADPVHTLPLLDAGTYVRQAEAIAGGQATVARPFWQPPLYPYLMAACMKITGSEPAALRNLQWVLHVSIALLTCLVATEIAERRTGLIAGCLAALYGPLVFFSGQLLPAAPAAALNLLMLYLLIRAIRFGHWGLWLASGVTLGLAIIMVPNSAVFLPIVVAWCVLMAKRNREPKPTLIRGAILLAGVLISVLPVTAHNYRTSGYFVPVSTNGGINLYIGNNPDAERTMSVRAGHDWKALVLEPREHGATNTVQASRYFTRKVMTYATTQPSHYLHGLATKTGHVLNSRELPRNVDLAVFRAHSSVLAALTPSAGPLHLPFGLLAPLALIGMVSRFRKRDESHLVMGFLVLYLLSVAFFFPSARYRLPAIPPLIIFAAIGICSIRDSFRDTDHFLRNLAIATAGLVLVNIPIDAPTDRIDFTSELYTNTGIALQARGNPDAAMTWYNRALEHNPDYADAHYQLATLELIQGTRSAAMMKLAKVLELDPQHARAYEKMGMMFFQTDDMTDAAAAFRRSLQHDPWNANAWNQLGSSLAYLHRYKEAAEAFEAAISLNSAYASAILNLARIHMQTPDYDKATHLATRVLALNPGDPGATKLLADIYRLRHQR